MFDSTDVPGTSATMLIAPFDDLCTCGPSPKVPDSVSRGNKGASAGAKLIRNRQAGEDRNSQVVSLRVRYPGKLPEPRKG